jgi:hypothetical protein
LERRSHFEAKEEGINSKQLGLWDSLISHWDNQFLSDFIFEVTTVVTPKTW